MGFFSKVFKKAKNLVEDAIDDTVDFVEDKAIGTLKDAFSTTGKVFQKAWDVVDDPLENLATTFVDEGAHLLAAPIDLFFSGQPIGDILSSTANSILDISADAVGELGTAAYQGLRESAYTNVYSAAEQAKKRAGDFINGKSVSVNKNRQGGSVNKKGSTAQIINRRKGYGYGSRVTMPTNRNRVIYR